MVLPTTVINTINCVQCLYIILNKQCTRWAPGVKDLRCLKGSSAFGSRLGVYPRAHVYLALFGDCYGFFVRKNNILPRQEYYLDRNSWKALGSSSNCVFGFGVTSGAKVIVPKQSSLSSDKVSAFRAARFTWTLDVLPFLEYTLQIYGA